MMRNMTSHLLWLMKFSFLFTIPLNPIFTDESRFLKNIKKLTKDGTFAEGYFNPSASLIVFQGKLENYKCDQIFLMDTLGNILKMISTGRGRTTCSFFLNDSQIIFSSTHEHYNGECPYSHVSDSIIKEGKFYAWPLFNYDIYIHDLTKDSTWLLFSSPGYDAELEGPDPTGRIVFTSTKDGDLDIYVLEPPYTQPPKRITNFLGYDGGSFFSPYGRYIVFRSFHLKDSAEILEYKRLLELGVVKLLPMEIFVYDTEKDTFWQVTHSPPGVTNFAPYMLPDERRIIFASNYHKPNSFSYHLYLIDIDGKNLQQVTFEGTFNSFPMISRDSRKIIFTSNRDSKKRGEYHIYIADWIY